VLILLTLAAGVGLAGPAAAHNVLTSSDPTDGSTLQAAPTTVRLTFDQPVQDFEPVVTVIGPDGNRYESGAPEVDSTVVTAGVEPVNTAATTTTETSTAPTIIAVVSLIIAAAALLVAAFALRRKPGGPANPPAAG